MKNTDPYIRRCQRVIRMVSELHRLGYQQLRIMPFIYPLACRVAIAPRSAFSAHNGAYIAPGCEDWTGSYTAASGNEYFNWTDAKSDNARQLAEKYIERFPRMVEQAKGRDWEYAGWLSELVGYLEGGNLFPFVQEEYFETKPYSLTYLPIWDRDQPHDGGRWLRTDFPLPPPGPVPDDPSLLENER